MVLEDVQVILDLTEVPNSVESQPEPQSIPFQSSRSRRSLSSLLVPLSMLHHSQTDSITPTICFLLKGSGG